MDSVTDIHTYIETDREKHAKYIHTVRHTHTDGHTHCETYRHTDMHLDSVRTDGQVARHTHTDIQTGSESHK